MGTYVANGIWYSLVGCAIAYTSFVVGGAIFNAHVLAAKMPTLIHDDVQPNTHHLWGTVTVLSPCDQLSVHTNEVSPTLYQIVLETWKEPSVQCAKGSATRSFETIVFAPTKGVSFIASLDGAPLPIAVTTEAAQ